MRINVRLMPLTPNYPGRAKMCIRNWEGAISGLSFSVQRNQDGNYLDGNQNTWNSSPYWFILSDLESLGDDLSVDVGADLIDPILENINANYRITVRDETGAQGMGILKPEASLLPSSALGSSQDHQAKGQLSKPTTPVAAPIPEPEPEPEVIPEPEPEIVPEPEPIAAEPEPIPEPAPIPPPMPPIVEKKKGGKGLLIIVLLVIVLAIAGAAIWWFLNQKPSTPAATPENQGGSCSVDSMKSENELTFIQACLKETNDSKAILEVIQQAKSNNHCGIAQRLYANRAQAGDVQIALAYAKEYDPKFYQSNKCFKEADASTASYWYETVILNEPSNTEAKQRLEELAP